jgi:hypothetical protein
VVRGADNPTLEKILVTKSEEVIAGYFIWQKLLRKARAHVGCRANDNVFLNSINQPIFEIETRCAFER